MTALTSGPQDEDDDTSSAAADRDGAETEDGEAPVDGTEARPRSALVEIDADEDEDEDDDPIDEDPDDEEEPLERVTETVVRRGKRKPKSPTVAQKEKKPMSKPSRKPKEPTLDEIPRDEVLALANGGYDRVRLDLRRQLPNGQWAGLKGNILVPPKALFDFQNVITQFAGGGVYLFDVTDPSTREKLTQRWKETYAGNPSQPKADHTIVWNEQHGEMGRLEIVPDSVAMGLTSSGPAGTYQHLGGPTPNLQTVLTQPVGGRPSSEQIYQMAVQQGPQPQRDAHGRMLPPAPNLVPPWLQTYPAEIQWENVIKARVASLEERVAKGDPTANQWVHHEIRRGGDLQADLAATRTELFSLKQQMADKIEAMQKEAQAKIEAAAEAKARAERELEQTRADARYETLKAEMLAMNNKPSVDWGGLISAIAPLGVAYLSSQSERAKVEKDSESKLVTTMLSTMNKEQPSKLSPELIAALAPLALPVIQKWVDGPATQAGIAMEMSQSDVEQKMLLLKMMHDMVAASIPEQSPWQPMLESLIQMIGSAGMALSQQKQLPRQPAGLPSGGPQPQYDEQFEQMRQSDPDAAADVELIYSRLPPALGFHTVEWRVIMFNLHARLEVPDMAEIIVELLLSNLRFETLPSPLERVFTKPEESLRNVLKPLPIAAKDPDYVEAVIEAVLAEIKDRDIQIGEDEPEPTVVDTSDVRA